MVLLVNISPCEQYLFIVGVRGHVPNVVSFHVVSLEDCSFGRELEKDLFAWTWNVNCAVWMPLSSPYSMSICTGNASGKIFLYT